MTTTAAQATDRYQTCPGCGRSFKGERGLRVHQTARFVSMSCKPVQR